MPICGSYALFNHQLALGRTTTPCPAQAVAALLALPRDEQIPATLRLCLECGGTLIRPGQVTHLFEITLLGIHARGEDLPAAARNWLTVGRNQHPADPEAGTDLPGETLSEYARALAILARPEGWRDDQLRAACNSILLLSSDWALSDRARQMLRQLDREAALRGQA